MSTINFTGNAFVLLSFDSPSPLPELPPEGSNDNPAPIVGPVVEPPGWPDLNNLYMGGFQPQNPNHVLEHFLPISGQLPSAANSVVNVTLPQELTAVGGNNNVFEIASVPEPSTTALIMLGCAAAAVSKRFSKGRR